ncbi:MAG: hypothetical protein JWL81_3342 [Verrucomicrobiales bacterium]|nr:hypothetical protein [Verrucomicrobiales bacterium]
MKKHRTLPPAVVIAVLAAAAGVGWLGGILLENNAISGPAGDIHSGQKSSTGKTGPAVSRPAADPTTEAAVAWLRSASILTRQPRDFAAELDAKLGDPNDVLRAWLAADADACWTWFQREAPKLADRWEEALLQDLLTGREAEAFAWLKALPLSGRGNFESAITMAALRLPPSEAVALLARYSGIIQSDSSGLPDNAYELLQAAGSDKVLVTGVQGRELLSELMKKTATRDPIAAALWWQAQSPEVQAATVASLLGSHTEGPPPWTPEMMSGLVGCVLENARAETVGLLLGPWLEHVAADDPVGTLKWVTDNLPVDAYGPVVARLKGHWSVENLLRLTDSAPPRLMDAIVKSLAGDSDAANVPANLARVETLLGSAPGTAAHQLGIRLLESLPASSPLMREWVEKASADQVPPALLAMVASDRCQTTKDPAAVLAWLDTLEGKPVAATATDIATEWYGAAPEKAAAGILALPPGPSRDAGIRAAGAWLGSDPAAALTWLEALPPGDRPQAVTAVRTASLSPAARREILEKWGIPATPSPPPQSPGSAF